MDILKSDTFCAYSWFGFRNENNGRYRVCCAIDPSRSEYTHEDKWESMTDFLNGDYAQYIRKSLSSGIKLKECHVCWHEETHNEISNRQISNESVSDGKKDLSNTWLPAYFKKKTDYKSDLLLLADVKINNICNFECIMCNAGDSSLILNKWTNNIESEFVQDYLTKDPAYFKKIQIAKKENFNETILAEILELKNLKKLKIIGGEPLVNPKVIELLSNLDNSKKEKLSLDIVTNGSVDLLDTANKLGNYKHIRFIVSVDAIEELQEYIRRNSDWEQLKTNILKFQKHVNEKLSVSCSLTPQAASITQLPLLITWLTENKISFITGDLIKPDYLSFSVVPDPLKQFVIEQLSKLKLESADSIISKLVDSEYDPVLFEKFKKYIKWQDTFSKIKFSSAAPEWSTYFS